MHRFLIVIEKANGNFSAYSPDLPGLYRHRRHSEEAEKNMHEAVRMHVAGLAEDGLPIPKSESASEYVVV